MKLKLLALVLGVVYFGSSVYANSRANELLGSWNNDNVSYTFTKDSLYVEEKGIETDIYIYTIENERLILQNEIDKFEGVADTIVYSVNSDVLCLTFGNEKYEFKRE